MKQLELIYQGLKDCREIRVVHDYSAYRNSWAFYKELKGYIGCKYFNIFLYEYKEMKPTIEITKTTDCRRDLRRILKSIDPTYIKILEKG